MISGFGDKYRIAIRMCSNSHKKNNKQTTNKQNKTKTMQIIR